MSLKQKIAVASLALAPTFALAFSLPWVNAAKEVPLTADTSVIYSPVGTYPAPWAQLAIFADDQQSEVFAAALKANGRVVGEVADQKRKIEIYKDYAGPVSQFDRKKVNSMLKSPSRIGEKIFDTAVKLLAGLPVASVATEEAMKGASGGQTVSTKIGNMPENARMVSGTICYLMTCGEYSAVTIDDKIGIDELWDIATAEAALRAMKMKKGE